MNGMKRRKVVEVGDKGSGVSAYLPCLSFSLFSVPLGLVKRLRVMLNLCVCSGGMICSFPPTKVTSPLGEGGFLTAVPCVLLEVLRVQRRVHMCFV